MNIQASSAPSLAPRVTTEGSVCSCSVVNRPSVVDAWYSRAPATASPAHERRAKPQARRELREAFVHRLEHGVQRESQDADHDPREPDLERGSSHLASTLSRLTETDMSTLQRQSLKDSMLRSALRMRSDALSKSAVAYSLADRAVDPLPTGTGRDHRRRRATRPLPREGRR